MRSSNCLLAQGFRVLLFGTLLSILLIGGCKNVSWKCPIPKATDEMKVEIVSGEVPEHTEDFLISVNQVCPFL